jgi:hypothetical protein
VELGSSVGWPSSGSDLADRWLFDLYNLGMLSRAQVKTAVFTRTELPGEPPLEQAARGLAVAVTSGRLEPRGNRWIGWTLLAEGACLSTALLAARPASTARPTPRVRLIRTSTGGLVTRRQASRLGPR